MTRNIFPFTEILCVFLQFFKTLYIISTNFSTGLNYLHVNELTHKHLFVLEPIKIGKL